MLTCLPKVSSLDDVRTSQVDSNAAKSIALDHLGVIAARIRSSILNVQSDADKYQAVKPLDEVPSSTLLTWGGSDSCRLWQPPTLRNSES